MTGPHRVRDWALLAALVAMWGSAFLFIKLGVATVPPATLAASRLALGAATLYAVMRWRGLALPPAGSRWLSFGALAIVGNCIPFYLISWGQQVIDSALAGILMAIMPLATLLLAHFFVAGERMTANRALGFSLGFVGIVVLMGPAALAGLGGSLLAVTAQAAALDARPEHGLGGCDRVARRRADGARDPALFHADCLRGADFHVAGQLSVADGRAARRCHAARGTPGRLCDSRAGVDSAGHRIEPPALTGCIRCRVRLRTDCRMVRKRTLHLA
ncbi:MAG: DMT family transporter [Betaproteobacteria bacterium]|nr:DMT family transporter [Betaproteobacteria bacterium]